MARAETPAREHGGMGLTPAWAGLTWAQGGPCPHPLASEHGRQNCGRQWAPQQPQALQGDRPGQGPDWGRPGAVDMAKTWVWNLPTRNQPARSQAWRSWAWIGLLGPWAGVWVWVPGRVTHGNKGQLCPHNTLKVNMCLLQDPYSSYLDQCKVYQN